MAFLNKEQLSLMNFKSLGDNVLISDKASFYGCENISIGDNTRIDDFCVLSAGVGGIEIGRYVHIAIYSSLQGAGKITMEDFSGISSRVSIYSSNDDYSGNYMTNPTVPAHLINVTHADVKLCKHVLIGCNSVVLPGVILNINSAVGALSFVSYDCDANWIYKGDPLKKLIPRNTNTLLLEKVLCPEL